MKKTKMRKHLTIAVLLIINSFLLLPFSSSATTIMVSNTNDAGAGSLRQAVIDASSGDTITFSLSYPNTITLTSGVVGWVKNLTIIGPGSNLLAIDGNANGRVLIANGTNTISGLKIQNGNILSNHGAGIVGVGNLTLNDVSITGNTTNWSGGGIWNNFGTLTMNNCIVFNNTSSILGGGILSTGNLIMNNCIVGNNYTYGSAGGIFVSGTATLTDCSFSGNTAENAGGGIFNDGTLSISECVISANTSMWYGGGINNNTLGVLSITNCTIQGNTSSTEGGGIYNYSLLTLTNSTIVGNNSTNTDGGGIYNNDTIVMTNCTVSGNSVSSTGYGGGIYLNYTGVLTLMNCTFANNSATAVGSGDGLYLYNDGTPPVLTTTNTIFSNAGENFANSGSFTATSNGYNICSDATMSSFLVGTGDLNSTDPLLNAIAPNGGSTQTHSLQCGSPAINAGTSTGAPLTDQRGTARIGNTDIGSYEQNPILVAPSITTQPSNTTICAGNNENFAIVATGATGFQWQEDQGSGFVNLFNGGIYSGVTTDTMNLTGVGISNNGFNYRCIVIGGCNPNDTSNVVILTVNSPSSSSQTLVEDYGFSITVGTNTYTTTGIYTDTLTAANGCDSIVTTNLSINGASLSFDGVNDIVQVPSIPNPTGDFTVEAYFNDNAGGSNVDIVSKIGFGNEGWTIFRDDTNHIEAVMGDGTDWISVTSINPITLGQWYHIAMVYNSTDNKMSLFVNGVLQGSASVTPVYSGVSAFCIGGAYSWVSYFQGNIDEVRVWDYALCGGEIQNNMVGEIASTAPGLVANYHFNQGISKGINTSINTLTDVSGNGYDGTVINFALNGNTSNWDAPGGVVSGSNVGTFTPPSSSQTIVECTGYSITVGSNTYNSTGIYTDVLIASNGCDSTVTTNLTINAIPTVTLQPFTPDTVCVYDAPFTLVGGLPASGTFSGTGVSGGVFNPTTAGAGAHLITYTYSTSSSCIDSASQTIFVDLCTGLSTQNNTISVTIYPNPNDGLFYISTNEKEYDILITNVFGEQILCQKNQNRNSIIDLTNNACGIYFVKLKTDHGNTLKKIIIER